MKVYVPGLLTSYTQGQNSVQANGATLGDVLADLDARYPGIRFRIVDEQDRVRRHIRIFVNDIQAYAMSVLVKPGDEIMIVGALSGG